jgi:hypothetical protein
LFQLIDEAEILSVNCRSVQGEIYPAATLRLGARTGQLDDEGHDTSEALFKEINAELARLSSLGDPAQRIAYIDSLSDPTRRMLFNRDPDLEAFVEGYNRNYSTTAAARWRWC